MITTWLIFICEGIVSIIFSPSIPDNSTSFSFLIILINAVAFFYGVSHTKYSTLLSFGYVFRLALLAWDCNFRNIFVLPNSGVDTWTYHLSAVSGMQTGNFGRGGAYSQTIAVIYRMFGCQTPIAQYANVLLAMSMIMVCIRIAELLELNEGIKDYVVKILCFLPNLAIINSILLRETVVMFMVALSVMYFVKWINDNKFSSIVLCVLCGLVGSIYHSGAIAIVLGAIILYILYNPSQRKVTLSASRIIVSLVLIVGFIVVNNVYGDIFLGKFGAVSTAEDIIGASESRNAGGSAYDVGFNIGNTYLNLFVNTPIRMLYFLGAPMPWDWRGINDIIAFAFDSVFFLYAILVAFKELKADDRGNRGKVVLFLFLALMSAAVFAWGVSNAGTALRHREKFIAVYVLLVALCKQKKQERIRGYSGAV